MKKLRTSDHERLLSRVIEEISHGDKQFFNSLSAEDREVVLSIIRELKESEEGLSPSLQKLWEVDYKERPVDILRFVSDPYYMGYIKDTLWPSWVPILEGIFAPGKHAWELIMSGAIGYGKTYIAVLCLLYKVYWLSCLKDIHAFFKLSPGSPITIGLYNVYKGKVASTSYAYMEAFIGRSPYFKERWARNPRITSEIRFPSNITVVSGASEIHALGDTVFGCLIDEADFMKKGVTEGDRGQAHNLHNSLIRRMRSRFMKLGEIPGMLCLVSSKTSEAGYVEQRIKDSKGNPKTYIIDQSIWSMKPKEDYSGRTFRVFIGDKYRSSKLIQKGEEEGKYGGHIIDVPTEHHSEFEEDTDSALRDVAGIATYSVNPFIPDREKIYACIDETRSHPFTREEFPIVVDREDSIEDFFDHKSLLKIVRSTYTPLIRPEAPRFIHIDIGLVNDALGFCMGHPCGYKTFKKIGEDGFEFESKSPMIYIDMMLRIIPEQGTRIDLQKVRDFVSALREFGYSIQLITFDSFQSEDSIQQLKKEGFKSELYSMDRKDTLSKGAGYIYLRQAILEERISYYRYEPFLREVSNLRRDLDKKTVDHPDYIVLPDGSKIPGAKDLSDACGGVVRACMEEAYGYIPDAPTTIQSRFKVPPQPDDWTNNEAWLLDDYDDLNDVVGIQ